MQLKSFLLAGALFFAATARAELKELVCTPAAGNGPGWKQLSKADLAKDKTHTKILDGILSRCSLDPSKNKVTCDSYRSDKTETTKLGSGLNITKYYHFNSQFNVQIFQSDMGTSFIEDNGRGIIYFGMCE